MKRKLFWSVFAALGCMIMVCALLFTGIFFIIEADALGIGILPWLIIGLVILVLLAGLLPYRSLNRSAHPSARLI